MIPFPNKKYDIIYADPPWEYSSRGPRSGMFGKLDYNSMKLRDVCALPIQDISKDNSVLFMWTTGAHILTTAPTVIKHWGFIPIRIDSVWGKTTRNGKRHAPCGPWGMTDTEFLCMGVKGSMCSKQIKPRNLYTLVKEPYTGIHSGKPKVFRKRIEKRFGDLPRIELFARAKVDKWDSWGEEV